MAICPNSGKDCEFYKPKKKKETDSRIKDFIEHYHSTFILKFEGQIPHISGAKDANSIKRMLVNWSLSDLKENLPIYFDCKKAFYIDNSFDICRFEKFMASKGVSNGQNAESSRGNGGIKSFYERDVEGQANLKKRATQSLRRFFKGGAGLHSGEVQQEILDGGRVCSESDGLIEIPAVETPKAV